MIAKKTLTLLIEILKLNEQRMYDLRSSKLVTFLLVKRKLKSITKTEVLDTKKNIVYIEMYCIIIKRNVHILNATTVFFICS